MTLDRLGRWRLPVVAALSLLIALVVVVAILLLGRTPTIIDGSPSPLASQPSDPSPPADGTPEAAVRAFFDAFARAGETNDPTIIEPFVNGIDSSAYQTAAGFLLGQRDVGVASVTTINELSDFSVSSEGDRATVEFTYRGGGYDVDPETGEPLESPVELPAERVRAVLVEVSGEWLIDNYEAIE